MGAVTEPLAIFPLPAVLLFPETRLPLHLFEPRYQQLARDVLAGPHRIGMVSVLPEHEGELAGDPPVFPIGCEGRIEKAVELSGGRFDLLLTGTQRFRIVGEVPRPAERLYRIAQIERLSDPDGDASEVAERREEVAELVERLLRRVSPRGESQLSVDSLRGIGDRAFVNGLAQTLDFDISEKLVLLQANSVSERFAALADLLRFRLVELVSEGGSPRGSLH